MEKIKKLKLTFKKEKIDGYIVPKNDEFFGEYVPNYKDRLNFISNFSGSYGFALILKKKNYLFVDGRYTFQAIKESGNYFKIITFPDKMPSNILKKRKLTIGYDPKLFTKNTFKIFFNKNNCIFKPLKNNLVDEIWKRRFKANNNKFYNLPKNSIGQSYQTKVDKIVSFLKKNQGDFQLITSSENNAWLLNIRGRDSFYSPIPNCFILISKNRNIFLFCDLKKISSNFKKSFKKIKFFEINSIYKILSKINKKKFIIDYNTCSIFIENIILRGNKIINVKDPIYNLKAIKNKKEIENIKSAHIIDGIALTRYLIWLKQNFFKKKITELSASKKLYNFRKLNSKFKFSSFPTISGSGPNGAIIHYNASKKTNRVLKEGDIYLVDSGGQYEFGTTDVTRTISLNNSNPRIKDIFTRVLKGHIAVSNFKITKNTNGSKIDKEARKYLKRIGLNYPHGTGHGVGYFLSVHENPPAISKNNFSKLQQGMVISNEPGYYEKDKFGIRIENLVYVKKTKDKKTFENFTLAPIDKDLINRKMLNKNEIKWLNNYHQKVFNQLNSAMNKFEVIELSKACSAI